MPDVEPAVQFALSQVGKPYVFGAAGPNTYDCSGLTMRAFQKVGINMPHSTFEQIKYGTGVRKSELTRGDLVFPDPGHVQIYLGNNMIVEAPHSGANVRVTEMWGFYAARRLGTASGSGGTPVTPATDLNPLDLIKAVSDRVTQLEKVFASLGHAVSWIAKPHNWYRLLLMIGGAIMLFLVARELVNEAV